MGRLHAKDGTTMVEVIVAFTVLLLIMGIFSQAVTLTGRMMARADDTLKANRSLAGDYYRNVSPESQDVKLRFKEGKNGEQFEISAIRRVYENAAGALYDVVVDEEEVISD